MSVALEHTVCGTLATRRKPFESKTDSNAVARPFGAPEATAELENQGVMSIV